MERRGIRDEEENFRIVITQPKKGVGFTCHGRDLLAGETLDTLLSSISDSKNMMMLTADEALAMIGAITVILNERFPDLFNSGKFIDQIHENLKKIRRAAELLKRRN